MASRPELISILGSFSDGHRKNGLNREVFAVSGMGFCMLSCKIEGVYGCDESALLDAMISTGWVVLIGESQDISFGPGTPPSSCTVDSSERTLALSLVVFWKCPTVPTLRAGRGLSGIVQDQLLRLHRSHGGGPVQRCFALVQFVQARDARDEAFHAFDEPWPWMAIWRWSVSLQLVNVNQDLPSEVSKEKKVTTDRREKNFLQILH